MALSDTQIDDFRSDIADINQAFSNDEIQRLYTRAGSYEGAILLAIDQLIMNATKLTRYQQNMTSENREQVLSNLLKARSIWESRLAAATNKNTTRFIGISGGKARQEQPGD